MLIPLSLINFERIGIVHKIRFSDWRPLGAGGWKGAAHNNPSPPADIELFQKAYEYVKVYYKESRWQR